MKKPFEKRIPLPVTEAPDPDPARAFAKFALYNLPARVRFGKSRVEANRLIII